MTSTQEQAILRGTNCELAFDELTRQLYATDASNYELMPQAVAFPRSDRQVSALIDAAGQTGLAVTPRGAGTGLTGGAIGEGLIIDFSRYNRQISELDLERQTVRVEAGVILDQLNNFLRPHGFCFGPDVATSSRATLGGMIANNSSGAHAPYYGTTADHVCELDIVLADGRITTIGPGHDTLRKQRELLGDLLLFHELAIQDQFPPGLVKRYPGYAIHRCLSERDNLNQILCGSEGTLAAITAAELRISPLPESKGLVLLFFDSIGAAMEATVQLLDLKPAAIEHLDDLLLDQTRNQLEFKAARDLLELDSKPCRSLLAIEFFENVDDCLALVLKRKLGRRTLVMRNGAEASLVWGLRKAGLSLLTGRKGPSKPVTVIEDAAVRPRDLAEYVSSLQKVLSALDLQASFYGHAAAGLLHVRPLLNLKSPGDLQKFRQVADEVSSLVRRFHGSIAGEHGVGIARTEFLEEQIGENLLGVMREIKFSFDPNNLFNPGKIIPDGRFRIEDDLRKQVHVESLPFTPTLAFADRDGSFLANLEQCNGCGGCRKETASMCPTFLVLREEVLSTRGRANAIRWALQNPGGPTALLKPELTEVLGSCLSCKACVSECPANVNLALLKAELLHARIQAHGLRLRERLISAIDLVSRAGCMAPTIANALMKRSVVRRVLESTLGISAERQLPFYASRRFDKWFARKHRPIRGKHGRVILWDDTFVRYYEPHIGVAAVKVLEAAGYQVALPLNRKCCGRPAFSQGDLQAATEMARHNIDLLLRESESIPIIFLEPSCYSMFHQDYGELKIPGAGKLANRCYLFEDFVDQFMTRDSGALSFKPKPGKIVIHGHCHVKALLDTAFLPRLAQRLPLKSVQLLNSACCGMAGAFGFSAEHYELSMKVAEPLVQMIRAQPFGTTVVASGTSCRHQLADLVPIRARHMAEVLAEALSS